MDDTEFIVLWSIIILAVLYLVFRFRVSGYKRKKIVKKEDSPEMKAWKLKESAKVKENAKILKQRDVMFRANIDKANQQKRKNRMMQMKKKAEPAPVQFSEVAAAPISTDMADKQAADAAAQAAAQAAADKAAADQAAADQAAAAQAAADQAAADKAAADKAAADQAAAQQQAQIDALNQQIIMPSFF